MLVAVLAANVTALTGEPRVVHVPLHERIVVLDQLPDELG